MLSWQYIAGFFDGEGHVGLGRQQANGDGRYSRGSPRLTMVQAGARGERLLLEIQAFLRAHEIPCVVEEHNRTSRRPNDQVSYHIRITGFNGVNRALGFMFPFLHIKKVEAQDIIRYSKVFPSLKGRGHSHSDNTRKAWVTRRERYVNGYKRAESPSINGSLGCAIRWKKEVVNG